MKYVLLNSRRLDVAKGPDDTAPRPGVRYENMPKEENLPYLTQALEIAKEILK